MPAPGTFTIKPGQGAGGDQTPHLLLTGANGEPIIWSEVYTSAEAARGALNVVVRTVLEAASRIEYEVHTDETSVERVTDILLGQS